MRLQLQEDIYTGSVGEISGEVKIDPNVIRPQLLEDMGEAAIAREAALETIEIE